MARGLGALLVFFVGCAEPAEGFPPYTGPDGVPPGTTSANVYSWDGRWTPAPSDFPLDGMLDQDPSQAGLPPGLWGWDGECDCPGNEGTAIYDNEIVNRGQDFERVEDPEGRHFGWRLVDTDGGDSELNHRGDHFAGSRGADIFDLTSIAGTGGITLGEGPDMLRYQTGRSTDLRTGSSAAGAFFDNDLVIVGSDVVLPMNTYDIDRTTIHTGPGSDLVFARNFGPAAIDLGNGGDGRTDTIDPQDGDDMAVLSGNMRDFRVYGGRGADVFVWYVDQTRDDRFLGPSFYGGGGWGEAVWGDDNIDRLILAIDPATEIVHRRGDHDDNPGSLLAMIYDDYEVSVDGPTETDAFARYYGTVPVGPNGEHTVTLSYRSPDGLVFTHDFYITSVEEIQVGTGTDAIVYRVDQAAGTLTAQSLTPLTDIPSRVAYNTLFDTFGH